MIRATCGTCGLSWDDSIATGYTPAPSGRCPFEYFHADDGARLPASAIPADFPVRPLSRARCRNWWCHGEASAGELCKECAARERKNARARERRAEAKARDPRPGSPEFDALPYAERARIRGYLDHAAANDWRAILAALREAHAVLEANDDTDTRRATADVRGRVAALLAKHEGADK